MRKKTVGMFFTAVSLALIVGCSSNDPNIGTYEEQATIKAPLKLDANGDPEACEYTAGENCYMQGPGQKVCCDPDGWARYYQSDDNCTYPGLEGGPVTCEYAPCATDDDCAGVNPDPENLNASCIYTQATFADESAMPGLCFFGWEPCSTAVDTPCENSGFVVCKDGECACTALPDTDAASSETCNHVDDDCDGETDEGFMLGQACDGPDGDDCEMGTYTCAASGLSNECTNETVTDLLEVCDYVDNDCDEQVDEGFDGLGDACDGDDADLCEMGTLSCGADQMSVVCAEELGEGIVEVCDEQDNDCDGEIDEDVKTTFYADEDGDGYGDPESSVLACQPPDTMVEENTDCDDSDDTVYPAAPELCDLQDNDCDEQVDEGFDSLGDACDGEDDDWCALGTVVCSGDGLSTMCDEVGMNQVEACDGQDNDCDGDTDEGCDDDSDGWCDSAMLFGPGAVCGQPGDCNDEDADVNPGTQEKCSTAWDDNCDGDTEFLADGVTPACSSCANAIALPCGEEIALDMLDEPNTGNSIESYTCATPLAGKTKTAPGTLSAPEIVIYPDADPGTAFSLQILTSGTGTIAARLHESCEPDDGTSSVSATPDGTCAGYSTLSVGGGTVGMDWIALDAESPQQVTVKFTCQSPVQ